MTESRDPFEDRLAQQLIDLAETALPGRSSEEDTAAAAMATARPTRWRAWLVAAAAVVTAIATTIVLAPRPLGETAPSTSPSPTDSGLTYSCGGHPFSPAIFNEPELDLQSSAAGAALAEFIASGQRGEELLPAAGWHLAGSDDSTASFVASFPGDPAYAEAQLERDAAGWQVVGWGQCRPRLELAGVNAATWTIVPGQEIDATTRTFSADVTEAECAGGQSSEGRVRAPLIIYEPDRVVVAFTVEPLGGDQDCPSNPATRVRVELSEPLGDRELLDGGMLPWQDPRARE
jgi:hypothetical protein